MFPPDTAAAFRENDRRAVAGGGVLAVETLEYGNGEVHHALVSKFPIPGSGGEPGLVGGVAIDITDRVHGERERERLVGELREADRRKDEFLATLAHELRNPLAPIRNALSTLRSPRADPATAGRMRKVMERQAGHLDRLIDDLLDVSRVMRGKVVWQTARVDLTGVLAHAVETARPLIDAKGHKLAVSVGPGPLPVDGDPIRLAQVATNLLTKAAKYTDPGGRIRRSAGPGGVRPSSGSGTPGSGSPRTCCRGCSTCSSRRRPPWSGRRAG